MQIEVFEPDAPLRADREVWVRVLSNEVVDWPTAYMALNSEQRKLFDVVRGQGVALPNGSYVKVPVVAQYFPHLVTKDEKKEHGYLLEDWFVFEVAEHLVEPPQGPIPWSAL